MDLCSCTRTMLESPNPVMSNTTAYARGMWVSEKVKVSQGRNWILQPFPREEIVSVEQTR
jgi:hypothetical protein